MIYWMCLAEVEVKKKKSTIALLLFCIYEEKSPISSQYLTEFLYNRLFSVLVSLIYYYITSKVACSDDELPLEGKNSKKHCNELTCDADTVVSVCSTIVEYTTFMPFGVYSALGI